MTNRLTRKVRRTLIAVAAATGVAVTSGCGFTVEKLPLPKPGASGETYTLHAVFENALNLPDQAKVKIGGSDVGVVSNIRTKNFQAIVDMAISKDIELPVGTTAELRQATPLGDVFIAVSKPKAESGAQPLHDGDTLGLDKTSAGATVEELLISVSMLFNGGGIAALSKLTSEMDSIVGGRGDQVAHLITEMTGVIGSLNDNSARVDSVLAQFSTLATTIESKRAELGQVADTLPQMIGAVAENNRAIGDLLSKISVTSAALGDYANSSGDQLGSLLGNVQQLMDALSRTDQTLGPALDALHEVKPGLDATLAGNSLAVYATLTNLDLSVLSDPAHGKLQDLRDVQDTVGSLITVLQLIQARVTGAYK
ncbi:MCE family protein [Nocardia australiensis]|uniref:MCE family protein n=1 Tax=Nocardia australiensis TaxID=2887191 RepID=UPI001D1422B5|nr:MCE family protein [Nocardia australiensis]